MLTLNEIQKLLTDFATDHDQIASSGTGNAAELNPNEREYPLLWISYLESSSDDGIKSDTFRIGILDRVNAGEEGDDDQHHELEVLSDTQLIAFDLLHYFVQGHQTEYYSAKASNLLPATEQFNDRIAGHFLDLTISQNWDFSKCQIPATFGSPASSVDNLSLYDFCDASVISRLTSAQRTCLEAEFAGSCDSATLLINGASVSTIASGGTRDQEVHNGDGDDVGSLVGSEWRVAASTVRNSSTPTYSTTVEAEDTLTLAKAKIVDSDGITEHLVNYLPNTSGTMFTAATCADADVEVNGVSVGTVPSGGTFNQLVQDDAGASVGTSANPSVVADCVVNNDAASPTFAQNIQPEQTFSLAQGKMLDSDGSTTVLANYKPNADGFMFTATPSTGGWQRPSEWIDMPTTTDGDAVTYLLYAVWPDQPNYFAMIAYTSSGDYTVDLYNDGTTITNHASASTSEFDLDYTQGTDEFAERGYKQVMIKITGNITSLQFNKRHSAETLAYATGALSCKITSQAITSLSVLFRGQNVYHVNMEEFEFFGTCNVTNIQYSFYGCKSLYSCTADFSNVTTATSTWQQTNEFDLAGVTMPTASFALQYTFYDTLRASFIGTAAATFMKGISYPYRAFYASDVEYFGTLANPIQLDEATSISQMFYVSDKLKQAYLTNTSSVTSLVNTFRGCATLRIVHLGDMSSCTSMTNAFTTNYSLATLRSSNLGVSFTVAGCHFSRAGLVQIFNDLPTVSPGPVVTVSTNPGTGDLTAADELIATDKGWAVTI